MPDAELPRYDYLLVAGPGRSGSTFLYRLLDRHPALCAPVIKEGGYYRSPRRFERARRRIAAGAILLDVSNLAWCDPALERLTAIRRNGRRILVVVLLRRHRERAASGVAFRRSRVLPALLSGRRGLERAALRGSLTPDALARIHRLGTDVATVSFEALTADPDSVLAALAGLCAIAPFAPAQSPPVNVSQVARNPVLTGAGVLAAKALRLVRAHGLLQRLKDDARVTDLFFRPAAAHERVHLAPATLAALDAHHAACLAAVEATGERLARGVWLRPGPSRGAGAGR